MTLSTDLTFKQRVILAVIAGTFALGAAYIAATDSKEVPNNYRPENPTSMSNSSNSVIISNGGNAYSNTNVNIQDNRTSATNGGIAISGNGNNKISINNSSRNSINIDQNSSSH